MRPQLASSPALSPTTCLSTSAERPVKHPAPSQQRASLPRPSHTTQQQSSHTSLTKGKGGGNGKCKYSDVDFLNPQSGPESESAFVYCLLSYIFVVLKKSLKIIYLVFNDIDISSLEYRSKLNHSQVCFGLIYLQCLTNRF